MSWEFSRGVRVAAEFTSERTYDTKKTPGLEHGAAVAQEADDESQSPGDDQYVGYHFYDVRVGLSLQREKNNNEQLMKTLR